MKKTVWYGGIIIAFGHFTMALPGIFSLFQETVEKSTLSSLDTNSFYLGLILIVIGTGLLKPNISSIVGQLYPDGSSKRDAGFSIFYMGINLGAFIAPLACSTVAVYDWHFGFGLAGLGMVIGLIQYKMSLGTLEGKGELLPPQGEAEVRKLKTMKMGGLAFTASLFFLVAIVFTGIIEIDAFGIASLSYKIIGVITVLYFGYVFAYGGLNADEKKKTGAIVIVILFSALFWSGFEQAGSTLNLFAERFTDRSFLGWEIPTGYFQSINSMFIIIFAPFFGAMWVWLGRRNLEPSSPAKFAFGLILLGLGFLVMYFAAKIAASGELAAPTWLVFTYMLHTFGELSLSPVGLSLTTKLAPKKFQGQMMGMWFISVALGNLFAGLISGEVSGGTEDALAEMPSQYFLIVSIAIGAGIVLLLISKPIRKLMGNVH